MFSRFFAKGKTERAAWEAKAVWFRVRFTDPAQLRQCFLWLATATTVGRVALWHQRDAGQAMLHVGLPPNAAAVFSRMALDYDFFLQPKLDMVPLPPIRKLAPLADGDLPWDVSFLAHLVGEQIFLTLLDEEDAPGDYFPPASQKKKEDESSNWILPKPTCGLNQQPVWPPVNGAVSELTAVTPDPEKWLLGLNRDGTPLQVEGALNLYGGREETALWLVEMCTQLIRQQPANLIILDDIGNLVPQLKRKNSVLRLINTKLNYMDMDNAVISHGFNPLTAVPGESEAELLRRWQDWFGQMGMHRSNVPMLAQAYAAGIRELMELVRWLDLPAQQIQEEKTASLRHRLSSFLQTRAIQEWVDWPDNPFRLLPDGGLLFSCACSNWQRSQMLCSVLLGALNSPGARLVLHGIPWQELSIQIPDDKQIALSNGPVLESSKAVLVGSHQAHVSEILGKRYFPQNPQLRENLHLLKAYEGVVINQEQPVYISWKINKHRKSHPRQNDDEE